jgi:hypothetical protein
MSNGPKPHSSLIAVPLQRNTILIVSGASESTREELDDE